MTLSNLVPGAVVRVRSVNWKVQENVLKNAYNLVTCRGLSGITRNKEAQFVWQLENKPVILDPGKVELIPDLSSGFIDTKLFLSASFQSTPSTSKEPLMIGRAAIDDLQFQHLPVKMALSQDRVRLLIADDVGLGKTFEAGLIASELAIRGRANRILVVTTRAMLSQFQKDFWTRFSIPLARLDSSAIQRMRNKIPAHFNVFDQFDRSIVSIDTLKKNREYRAAIQNSYWDLIIIDEAHNAANRAKAQQKSALRSTLAKLLSRKADSLLLLTATPHDGSHLSYASLIEMLDPTRVPNPSELKRTDIDDLVVRRFRTTPSVQKELRQKLQKRKLHEKSFDLSNQEEEVYQIIADLELDSDESKKNRNAIHLFRTTLAKSIFSSPAACIETLENRIRRIKKDPAAETSNDVLRLTELLEKTKAIDWEAFSKYQNLLKLIREELRWTGKNKRDRLVIFSERIETISWLKKNLSKDLNLGEGEIERIDGGSVEVDQQIQLTLEQFSQEKSKIRILIASDMASEGLNLHYQCHRLIHFDHPWSLLRFQQRNGRIDRYDQDRKPEIYYFVGKSTHPKVRQMWVLDKLVEKDEAVQEGLGDLSVFLGVGNAEEEENVVAEAVANNIGSEEFGRQMDERVAQNQKKISVEKEYDALFGEFSGSRSIVEEPTGTAVNTQNMLPNLPPRLYKDIFHFTADMLKRLSHLDKGLFKDKLDIDFEKRLIRMGIPDDLLATDSLGYSTGNSIDEKYMPVEVVGSNNIIELTDDPKLVVKAIARSRMEEKSWPTVQFLWEGHPILHWFADRAETLFENQGVPFVKVNSGLSPDETAVLIHGSIYNLKGAPIIDRWAVVIIRHRNELQIESKVEEVNDFMHRIGFMGDTPNTFSEMTKDSRNELIQIVAEKIPHAVSAFQTHLVQLHDLRSTEIQRELDSTLFRLSKLEDRYCSQLELQFEEVKDVSEDTPKGRTKHKIQKHKLKRAEIRKIFEDSEKWFETNRRTVSERNPFVNVKAVFGR